jgi:hypothetical protein
VITLRGLAVTVTNNFTWTVKFEGLTGVYQNRAGLAFYDPPNVGSSYDDFWMLTAQGWQPMHFPMPNLKANFAARVMAGPEPEIEILSLTRLAKGACQLRIRGPIYRSGVLEASADLKSWSPLQYFTFIGPPIDYVDVQAGKSSIRFYRTRLLSQPIILLSYPRRLGNGEFAMQLIGPPGRTFAVEASIDLVHWASIETNYFISLYYDYVDWEAPGWRRQFYRTRFVPDAPVIITSLSQLSGGQTLLALYGPAGRDCVIQASRDLVAWTPLSTNTFSYTSSEVNYLDPQSTNVNRRFYRALLAP